jgi:hypothetical protein
VIFFYLTAFNYLFSSLLAVGKVGRVYVLLERRKLFFSLQGAELGFLGLGVFMVHIEFSFSFFFS